MLARGLVGTLAVVANGVGLYSTHPKMTQANIIEMCQNGFELANHSYNHLDTPVTQTEWEYEVGEAKTKMETDFGYSISNFVMPGSWLNRPKIDSELGQYILQNYAFYEGYDGDFYTYRPNRQRYGYNHDSADTQTLAELKEKIDIICSDKLSMTILFHFIGYEGMGVSTADFESFLDYIVEKIDAGLLVNVTDIGLMSASVGKTKNKIINGNFDNLAANGYPTLFNVTGTPTVVSAEPHSSGNAITCTTANYIRKLNIKLREVQGDSEIFRLSGWHKTDTTGTARFIIRYSTTEGTVTFNKTMVSSGTYAKLETTFQIKKDVTNYIEVWIQPSSGTVTYADVKLQRIG